MLEHSSTGLTITKATLAEVFVLITQAIDVLTSARKAKLAEGILDGKAHETYQTLLDQEYAKSMAKNQNFGIADALIRQFGGKEKIK